MGKRSDKLGREHSLSDMQKKRLKEIACNLGRGKSLRKKFTWPGGTAEMELRILSVNEKRDAENDAIVFASEQLGDSHIPRNEAMEALEVAKATLILAKSCMRVGEEKPFFRDATEIGDIVTTDELRVVYKLYSDHEQMVDPDIAEFNDEEFAVIDEAIKKKASSTLMSIASSLPRSSLLILVSRLVDSLEGKSTST